MDYKKGKKSDFLRQRQTGIAPVIHWHLQLRSFTELEAANTAISFRRRTHLAYRLARQGISASSPTRHHPS
ncbi:hypothetical protein AAH995_29620, partial [Pseudomonas putida]